MSQIQLTVDKATKCSTGNYKLTLKSTNGSTAQPFGKIAGVKTYYMYVLPEANGDCPSTAVKGQSATIDLDDFKVVEEPFTTDDGKEITLKNLELK